MKDCCSTHQSDHGGAPYTTNIHEIAMENRYFRTALWTGCHLQMTLMCIPPCEDIGLEMHDTTDQLIRVEHGTAIVKMGKCKCQLNCQQKLHGGDAVFVPAGTWHNIINAENSPLRLSSVYAPPNHPKGTVHKTKKMPKKQNT